MAKPDLAGDGERRSWIVAGDHHRANAGVAALGDRLRDAEAHRVLQADQADVLELEVVLFRGEAVGEAEARTGHAEDAQPVGGRGFDLSDQRGQPRLVEVTEVGDRLGRAFRGNHVVVAVGRAPDVREREHLFERGYSRWRTQSAWRCSVSAR